MDSEQLATWIQDRILDGDVRTTAGPIGIALDRAQFDMTAADGTRALITVELGR